MSSSFVLTLILLAVVMASFYLLLQAEGGISQLPRLMMRVGINPQLFAPWLQDIQRLAASPAPTPTPHPFVSGSSRFSQGTCLQDAECFISGCSDEVCGNQKAVTSCEISPDFPNRITHSCGCVAGKCGWTKK